MTGTSAFWLWAPGMPAPRPLDGDAIPPHLPAGQRDLIAAIPRRAPVARSGSPRVWQHWVRHDDFMPRGVIGLSTQGKLVADLISGWQIAIARRELLGEQIQTPSLYQWGGQAPLPGLAGRFDDRLFHLSDGPVLKYGADPGYFALISSLRVTERQLPLRVFELGKGFRRSQAGELRGIERLSEFDLLEHHTLLPRSQALAEYQRQLAIQLDRHDDIGGDVVCSFRVVAGAAAVADNPVIRSAAARAPAVIEALPARTGYWSLTHTFYTSEGISTFHSQLDQVNPDLLGLMVPGAGDLAIIHTALGSAQHVMLVAEAAGLRRRPAELPGWLTPVQARFIPVRPELTGRCLAMARELGEDARADVDDRPRTVAWRVRRAAAEWIPFVIVVGPDDDGQRLRIRFRDGSVRDGDLAALRAGVAARIAGFPRLPLGYDLVSRRVPLGSGLD